MKRYSGRTEVLKHCDIDNGFCMNISVQDEHCIITTQPVNKWNVLEIFTLSVRHPYVGNIDTKHLQLFEVN